MLLLFTLEKFMTLLNQILNKLIVLIQRFAIEIMAVARSYTFLINRKNCID